MAVKLFFETTQIISPSIWRAALEKALERIGLKDKDVTVSFVSKSTISKLNELHLRREGATDVISVQLGKGKGDFGELAVCPEVVEKNAEQYKVPFTEELLRVCVHGFLHLKGFEHEPYKLTPERGIEAPSSQGEQTAGKQSGNSASSRKGASGQMFSVQESLVKELRWDVFVPRLVVGLGNPGEDYLDTRHNTGFRFIDFLVQCLEGSKIRIAKTEEKFGASIRRGGDFVFAKPLSGMNRAGESVRAIVKNLETDPRESILIVHDELDIPLGKYKLSYGRGRLHKGVRDIERSLKTKKFWRLRIGIDNRKTNRKGVRVPGEEYVLMKFSPFEKRVADEVIDKTSAEVASKIASVYNEG